MCIIKRNKMTPLVLLPQQPFQLQSLSIKKPNISVLIPIIGLAALDGSWFKTKTGNFSFYRHSTSGKIVVMATAFRVPFCFFCDAHFNLQGERPGNEVDAHLWCQMPRTLFEQFQSYCLFSILPFLVANLMTSSLI